MTTYFNIKNDPILNPPGNISLGSASYPYESIYTTGNLVVGNSSFSASALNVPKISAIVYPGNDTAVDTAGSQTVTLTGSGFVPGAQIIINQTAASVVTVVNSETLTFTTSAQNAGSYIIYLVNPDGGTAIAVPGLQYSGVPAWSTTAGSLGSVTELGSVNTTVSATGDAPVTYSLFSGTLPDGVTLNANGTVSGTSVVTNSPTTFTFTIRATDAQNQDTDRTFSITVNPDSVTWSSPADGTTYSLNQNNVISSVTLSASADSGRSVSYTANTLPAGISLSGNLIVGTPTVVGNVTTQLTATSSTTNRSATRTINWIVNIAGDTHFSYITTLISASTSTKAFDTDLSSNNFAVTIAGDTRPYNFNPYTPGYYSNYFDGTGDYLSLAANAAFAFGTGDFTVEAWIYRTGGSGNQPIAQSDAIGSSTNDKWWFAVAGGGLFFGTHSSGGFNIVTTTSFNEGTWYHVAVSRASGTMYMFVNGVSTAFTTTGTPSGYSLSQNGFVVGGMSNSPSPNYWTGYISNFRIVKGSATYTTSFTPGTSPLTAITNTSLLTCQSNRLIDNSTNNFAITRNGDTSVKPFNPYTPNTSYSTYGSTYFDGTGDFLSTPTGPAAFDFTGTKTLTLEFWVNSPAYNNPTCFFDLQECQPFRVGYSTGTLWWQATSGGGNIITASVTLAVNTWYHIAFVRDTDTLYIFVNGVQVATSSYGNNWPSTASGYVRVGCNRGDTWFVNGYMSDVRLVKGTALYTSAFTPPTAPLTAISGTSLLTCQTNQSITNNLFLDKSTNDFTITRAGNTTQGTFSPYGENWSNYFDGAGDYLRLSNTVLNNSAFTISFWFYPTTSSVIGLFDSGPGQTSCFRNYPANTIQDQNGGSVSFTANTNQWNWMSIVGDGTNFTVYLNGSSAGSAAYASLVDSSFTIGTINSGGDGAYTGYISNFRIKNVASVDAVPTTPLQPVAGTSLLTCANPNFVDNSANNFTITRNGDVSVQKFGPFAGTTLPTPYYSGYFDGTGDYLRLSTIQNFGTADFTVEAWVYLTAVNTNGIYASTGATGKSRLYTHITNTSKLQATLRNSDGTNEIDYTGSTTINLNTWYHVAIVRYNNTLYLYVNGVSDMTPTPVTQNLSTNDSFSTVGSANATRLFNGYMSNLRVVAGTAVYTANFTPPTSPLTAITNTSLLTCQSSTLVDNSINNVTITVNGDTKPRTFNPFTVTYSTKQSYTPSVYGGSMYFDGTGDYVTVSTLTPATALSSGNWTFECWFYASATKAFAQIIGNRSGASGSTAYVPIAVSYESATIKLYSSSDGGSWNLVNAGTIGTVTLQSWNHVAVVRNGNNLEAYLNGIKVILSTGLSGVSYTATNLFYASGAVDPFAGYISDVRLITGTALYTSNFVPQNAPVAAVKNTTLLLNGTGAGIYDSTTNTVFETVGDAKLSTTTVKFAGTTSVYFDGTGDYLAAPMPPACLSGELGTGDFTIEYWMNATAAGTYVTVVGTQSIAGNTTAGIWRASNRLNGANGIYFNYTNGGSFIDLTFSTTNYNDSTWHHVAFVRSSGTLKAYVDGTQVGSGQTVTQNLSSGQRIYVGYNVQDSAYYTGYISDLRITKGVARYTANFTAPTSPFFVK